MAGSKHVISSLSTLPSWDDRLHNLLHQLICKKLCISLMLPCLNVQIGFCFPWRFALRNDAWYLVYDKAGKAGFLWFAVISFWTKSPAATMKSRTLQVERDSRGFSWTRLMSMAPRRHLSMLFSRLVSWQTVHVVKASQSQCYYMRNIDSCISIFVGNYIETVELLLHCILAGFVARPQAVRMHSIPICCYFSHETRSCWLPKQGLMVCCGSVITWYILYTAVHKLQSHMLWYGNRCWSSCGVFAGSQRGYQPNPLELCQVLSQEGRHRLWQVRSFMSEKRFALKNSLNNQGQACVVASADSRTTGCR